MPGRKSPVSALITAEHASRMVPDRWARAFRGHEAVLDSHRAWDPGSAELAEKLATKLDAPLLSGRVTRLLVDLNRSAGHPRRLSEYSKALPAVDRSELIRSYWEPHWKTYAETVKRLPGPVVHIACHSFTPVLEGRVRCTDIGLLYDPSRKREKAWCRKLQAAIRSHLPGLNVHLNQPYRGTSNGLGQQHRQLFDDHKLITLEVEVNTALLDHPQWQSMENNLVEAIAETCSM